MRIGIDIDDTISDTATVMYQLMLKEDKKKRNTGIVDPDRHIFSPNGRFDWTEDEIDRFLYDNFERESKKFKVIQNADKVIAKLKEEGHEIYLITARSKNHWPDREKSTIEWLKFRGIKYDQLLFSKARDKSDELRQYKIDIMIDDSISSCALMEACGIPCIVKLNTDNYNKAKKHNFRYMAEDWQDIYNIIRSIENNKELG